MSGCCTFSVWPELATSVIFGAYDQAYCIGISRMARRERSTGCRFNAPQRAFEQDRVKFEHTYKHHGSTVSTTS